MKPSARLVAAVATLVLLCSCSSDPVTRYYVLSPVEATPLGKSPAATDRSAKPATLIIKNVRLPQYLDRSQLVVRGGDHRLHMSEFELWGGNLQEDMTRILAVNLGRLLASDRVIAAPHTLAVQPDYRIEVEVLGFERDADGRVKLAARWWLTRGSDATLLASPSATISSAPLGNRASNDELVAAMSAVYGDLAQAIARNIRSHEAGGS